MMKQSPKEHSQGVEKLGSFGYFLMVKGGAENREGNKAGMKAGKVPQITKFAKTYEPHHCKDSQLLAPEFFFIIHHSAFIIPKIGWEENETVSLKRRFLKYSR